MTFFSRRTTIALLAGSGARTTVRTSQGEILVAHEIVVVISTEATLNVENAVTGNVSGLETAEAESFHFDGGYLFESRQWT